MKELAILLSVASIVTMTAFFITTHPSDPYASWIVALTGLCFLSSGLTLVLSDAIEKRA